MTGHTLIIGMGGSGKSTLALHLVNGYIKRRVPVYLLDAPMTSTPWPRKGVERYKDRGLFLAKIKATNSSFVVVDESGSTLEKENEGNYLTTTARHHGHTTLIIAHKHTQLQPVLRDNVDRLILFQCAKSTREVLSDEWGLDETLDSPPPFHFWLLERNKRPVLGSVTPEGIQLNVSTQANAAKS